MGRRFLSLLVLSLALSVAAGFAMPLPQDDEEPRSGQPKVCDNSGAPNRKDYMHKCACQQATAESCQKPVTNMPGCGTNCRPKACKCKPEKCS
jgi:hypothetical protein